MRLIIMKKRIIAIFLTLTVMLCLGACKGETASDKDAGTKTDSTAETTADTTKEETDEEEKKLSLNDDVISEVGMTYTQLTEKHGNKCDSKPYGGGIGYFLEKGYGSYVWALESLDYGDKADENNRYPIERDENSKPILDKLQDPKKDEICTTIDMIDAENIFVNAEFPIAVADLEKLEGIRDFDTGSAPYRNKLQLQIQHFIYI